MKYAIVVILWGLFVYSPIILAIAGLIFRFVRNTLPKGSAWAVSWAGGVAAILGLMGTSTLNFELDPGRFTEEPLATKIILPIIGGLLVSALATVVAFIVARKIAGTKNISN